MLPWVIIRAEPRFGGDDQSQGQNEGGKAEIFSALHGYAYKEQLRSETMCFTSDGLTSADDNDVSLERSFNKIRA